MSGYEQAYAGAQAVELTNMSFATGSLRVVSYARPAKLFTANRSLLVSQVGELTEASLKQIVDAVIALLRKNLKT
jgi:mRNA interferase MazF